VVQGAWFCSRWVLTRSSAMHVRMHFDQGVLGSLSTDRLLRAGLTIGADLHDKDRQRWLGACSTCVPASQSAWREALAATLLKQGETN
jgi:hypothetical protein